MLGQTSLFRCSFHCFLLSVNIIINFLQYLQYVHDNMGPCEKKNEIATLLESSNFKLGYLKYDWSVNSK